MDLHILEKERVRGDYIAFYYSWMGGSREDGYRQMVRRWSQKCMVTGQDIWNRTQSMDSRNTEICFSYAKWHTVILSFFVIVTGTPSSFSISVLRNAQHWPWATCSNRREWGREAMWGEGKWGVAREEKKISCVLSSFCFLFCFVFLNVPIKNRLLLHQFS